jgi:hypothetical protein
MSKRFVTKRIGFETRVLDTCAGKEPDVVCKCDDNSWAGLVCEAMNADWEQFNRSMSWAAKEDL